MGRDGQRALQFGQPAWLNVEREDQCPIAWRCVVDVGVVLPGVHKDSGVRPQRRSFATHDEGAIRSTRFEKDVAVMMRVAHQRRVHVE
jgi:hypothetical protein